MNKRPNRFNAVSPFLAAVAVLSVCVLATSCGGGSAPSSTATSLSPSVTSTPPTSTQPPPTAQFTSLHDGSRVSYNQQVTGTVSGIPAGTYTWLVVEPSLTPGYYWPQTGPLNPEVNGQFRALTYIGQSATQNSGEEFTLMIVQASPDASQRFHEFIIKAPGTGLQGLPDGTNI